MAIAFIDTNSQTGHPYADDFYRMFPREPVLPVPQTLEITRSVNLSRMSFTRLLDAIHQNRNLVGEGILIVAHGTHEGLNIPLLDNGTSFLNGLSLETLRRNVTGALSDDRAAPGLDMSVAQLQGLKRRVERVRQLQLNRVEFRACFVGRQTQLGDALQGLKDVFGARRACGPLHIDFYSRVDLGRPTTDTQVWSQWLSDQMTATIDPPGGTPPNRFAWRIDSFYPYNIVVLADSQQAARDWIDQKLPGGQVPSPIRRFYMHAMLPSLQSRPAIFPGEPIFRQNLRQL